MRDHPPDVSPMRSSSVLGWRYRLAVVAAAAGLLLSVATATGSAQTTPASEVLSNESTFTRWAYVARIVPIHAEPSVSSPEVTRLHWNTEDGFPEIYLLLRASWDAQGSEWVDLRIPGRPNGRTGWVPRTALGTFHLTHQLLVVNRARLRMSFYIDGRLRWSAPVGIGARSTPTPPGRFWIRERIKIDDPQSGYWPYAFGTSDYSTLTDWPGGGVVGIHGPYNEPQLIPGRISHGCIRLRVADDEWLAQHLGLGAPLHVL
jgi:L,D-transpeptidase catalytic domain